MILWIWRKLWIVNRIMLVGNKPMAELMFFVDALVVNLCMNFNFILEMGRRANGWQWKYRFETMLIEILRSC